MKVLVVMACFMLNLFVTLNFEIVNTPFRTPKGKKARRKPDGLTPLNALDKIFGGILNELEKDLEEVEHKGNPITEKALDLKEPKLTKIYEESGPGFHISVSKSPSFSDARRRFNPFPSMQVFRSPMNPFMSIKPMNDDDEIPFRGINPPVRMQVISLPIRKNLQQVGGMPLPGRIFSQMDEMFDSFFGDVAHKITSHPILNSDSNNSLDAPFVIKQISDVKTNDHKDPSESTSNKSVEKPLDQTEDKAPITHPRLESSIPIEDSKHDTAIGVNVPKEPIANTTSLPIVNMTSNEKSASVQSDKKSFNKKFASVLKYLTYFVLASLIILILHTIISLVLSSISQKKLTEKKSYCINEIEDELKQMNKEFKNKPY